MPNVDAKKNLVEVAVDENQLTPCFLKAEGGSPFDLNKDDDVQALQTRLQDEQIRISCLSDDD